MRLAIHVAVLDSQISPKFKLWSPLGYADIVVGSLVTHIEHLAIQNVGSIDRFVLNNIGRLGILGLPQRKQRWSPA